MSLFRKRMSIKHAGRAFWPEASIGLFTIPSIKHIAPAFVLDADKASLLSFFIRTQYDDSSSH